MAPNQVVPICHIMDGSHMRTTRKPNSLHYAHSKPNFLSVCAKTDKFQFVTNGMETVRRWCSTCLQSHPHIHAFGFANCLQMVQRAFAVPSAHTRIWFANCQQMAQRMFAVSYTHTHIWFVNCLQMVQCMFAVPSAHARIWFANCSQMAQRMFAVPSTHMRIYFCELFADGVAHICGPIQTSTHLVCKL